MATHRAPAPSPAKQRDLILRELGACREASEFVRSRPVDEPLAVTYAALPDGRWLLWLAAKAGVDRKRIVLAACACAREALRHVPAGEERPRIAIETTERWGRGEATIEEVRDAACAAYAADAACAACAAYAAYAADAACAAHAAYAAYAADAAYADDARRASLARSADLVREHIQWPTVALALGVNRPWGREAVGAQVSP